MLRPRSMLRSIPSRRWRIANSPDKAGWIEHVRRTEDDLVTDEQTMLVELAAIVYDWPVRNPVVERALHEAAMKLLAMAGDAAGHHIPHPLPTV